MKKGKTAKQTYSKSKTTSSTKSKMSLREKELMAITIFAFFIFAFLLAVTNTSQQSNYVKVTGHIAEGEYERYYDKDTETYLYRDYEGNIYDSPPKGLILAEKKQGVGEQYKLGNESFIRDLFSDFTGEKLDINLGKYVIWFTTLFFVFGILGFFGFPSMKRGAGFIRFMLSLGLSFLGTAYLIPENIYTIIMSLEAVPMLLTALPFIAMLIATGTFLGVETMGKLRKLNVGKVLGIMSLWFVWNLFLIFRLIRAWIEKGFGFIFRGGGIVLGIFLILSLLILVFFKYFQDWIVDLSKTIIRTRADVLGTAEGAQEGRKQYTSSFANPWYNRPKQ